MQVTRLVDFQQCQAIAAQWDCMAHSVPFRRTAWLHSWWNHYRPVGDLYVLQVTDSHGQIVGLAPWFVARSLRQGRVLRPLGCGEVCSDYLGILATADHEPQVAAALARWLTEAASGKHDAADRWDLLDLVSVDNGDSLIARFVRELAEAGNHVHRLPAANCWRVNLPDSWDAYLAQLSKPHRKVVRRTDRQWFESGKARLQYVRTQEQLHRVMDVLIDLHQRRQTGLGKPGCFASSAFSGFLREAAERMLSEQTLRLYWLELDGQPIAAEYQMIGGDTTYAYLAGIDPDRLDVSPGHMLQVANLKDVIGEGQRAFDFLRGDEAYKLRWGVEQRSCVDYHVVPQRHTAQLRHQVWLAGDTMKQWIKAGLHMTGLY